MNFTVLGLVGPAGSGKDYVADWFVKNKHFVKIAFADPMKRFVLNTFPNITVDQLWGPSEERNKEFDISEIWWFEAIGHFGEGAKEIVNNVLNDGNRVDAYLKLHDWFTWLRRQYPNKISARVILQTLGTEWGRTIDPLLWAKYAHETAYFVSQGHFYSQASGPRKRVPGEVSAIPGAVIPDHRFKNEIDLTQERGGYVIRLNRVAIEGKEGNVGIQGHPSELEMRGIPGDAFDFVLYLEEGLDKVDWALETIAKDKSWEIKRRANSPS